MVGDKNKMRGSGLRLAAVIVGIFGAVTLAAAPAAAQRGATPVRIDVGGESEISKSLVLPLNKAAIVELPYSAADVLVSQPAVVDAVVRSPKRVYLLGMTVGQTNAFFFDARGRQILNLEIRVEQDTDALQDLIARMMPESRVKIEAINDTVILQGNVRSATEAANAHALAVRFIGNEEQVVNMLGIQEQDQVMLKVRIVEMQRRLVKQLGFDTNGTVTIDDATLGFAAQNAFTLAGSALGGLNGDLNTNGFGDITDFDLSFQALEQTGLTRILAEPNLTAISGESANFLAGGEFPIPVGQDNGRVSIEFKEFGIGLGFTPFVLSKGRINMKISTEVSELTNDNSFFIPGATGIDPDTGQLFTTQGLQVPGLSVRRANTTVELPSGGSLVMAGLLQEDLRTTIDGVPGIKDTPILGQLFRSRDFQNNESELVIIVTPYLVNSTHESRLKDPTEGFVPASDLETILLGKMISTYGLDNATTKESSLQGPMGFVLD
ncbi:MAG: type II and III secretion system protein family protein [Pseudomonadota bacterium]